MGKLLSFSGRVSRMGWWVAFVVFIVVYAILYSILNTMSTSADPSTSATLFILLVILALSLISLSINVRRWHDLNKSGWWVFINLIPILGALYSLVMLGFVAGDEGHNSYGVPPDEGAIL